VHQRRIVLPPTTRGLLDITSTVSDVVAAAEITTGLCHIFLQHTSASLVIQENADPDVLADLDDWFTRSVPDGDRRYRHADEGPDDMPAHIRAAITQTALTVPVINGTLGLGTWQGIYLFEHRTHPHRRAVVITLF
jgi:secondary thiamine-phosphate synthase enzyme